MKPHVIIGIATIEERKESLIETLESLEGQCDELHIYTNDYLDISLELSSSVCDVVTYGPIASYRDNGDISKFWHHMMDWSADYHYYALVCDDDLIYPPDYVETLIAGIERHDRKAVVGFHGKEYYNPVASYYGDLYGSLERSEARNYRCMDKVAINKAVADIENDRPVTIIGTGCTGWHSSLFKDNPLSMDDFKHPNMADIWFSKKCNDLGISRYVIPHEADWIKHSDKVDMSRTIANTARDNDAIQTGVFNSVEWQL